MTDYVEIEVDERVYEKIVARQREDETISETIHRLIDEYEERRATED